MSRPSTVLGPRLRRPAGPGPGDRRRRARRARPAARRAAADRERELHLAGGAGRARLDAVQQVRRGLPRPALLRRLRGGRPGRGDRHRRGPRRCSAPTHANLQPHSGASANLAAYAALLQPGDTGARDVAAARRPPHPRLQGQLLRQVVHAGALRRAPGHRADRLRRGPRPRPRAPAEDDHLRRDGLPAADRLRRVPRDRRRGRRLADGRRRALHRAGRRQGDPVAGAVRRRRHASRRTRCCAARAAA